MGTQKIAAPTYVLTAEAGHVFALLVRRIIREHAVRSVCDFGGDANPVLSLEEIAQMGLRYLVIDTSEAELRKTPSGYETRQLDLADAGFEPTDAPFDLVVSRFVAEHVADPALPFTYARGVLSP
ncbi:MAG: methyltransferase domain-containing protein [Solirubrobacteraceae bacterium]